MTIEEIQARKESQTFDCKSIQIAPKALAIPIVAMANADGGVLAIGTFYPDNGSIEVLESSVLNTAFSTPEKYPWVEEQRQELLDDGIIAYNDKHQLVFIQNHTFYTQMKGSTALSSVASLILHGNRNGWEYWCTEDGKQLGQIEGLKK